MPTLGTNVGIIESNRILLIKRSDFRLWSLPGGTVEPGESIAQAALREAREETGLEVRLTRLVGVYSLPNWIEGGNHIALFAAVPVGGALLEGADGEALDARYFHPSQLPDELVWWHRQRISDALDPLGRSTAWSQDAVSPFGPNMTRKEIYAQRDRNELPSMAIAYLSEHPGPGHETKESAAIDFPESADSSSATTVCLVRHGETDWNREGRLQGREDVDLNVRGREQARLTAVSLESDKWDVIVSSPLSRALETAQIIADHLGIPHVHPMEEFVERDYGLAAGLIPREREERYPDGQWPGLESRESVSARCIAGLHFVVERYQGLQIVVVSHGSAINSILAALSGGQIGTGKTILGNACVSTLHFTDGCWQIRSYNSVSHLGIPAENETE